MRVSSALRWIGPDPYRCRTIVRSQGVNGLTIGKLAAKGGVGVETIRYYQRRGLLTEPARGDGVRRYGDEDVRRLRFVRSAQSAGFTLEEIGELLGLDAVDDRARARELARARIAAIDLKIEELQAARASLSRLTKDCAKGGAGPCPIIAAFDH
ncbi:MerR family transcriptional regulator [Sphingomonas montanisoli]|uniref:MerR family transcriptional regulator n=1 Tax=Sphingomonas montanisoli TaxID=2606412 RepID=A0A5D9CEB8_9SPHN|nr:MerR family transcriptional regulator [Sphingomonas montanisoli]